MIDNIDPSFNFWDANPQMKIAFRKLFEEDKSKQKNESSKIMWAITLLWHPDSKFRSVGEEYRKKLIEDDHLKINDAGRGKKGRPKRFDWDQYKEEIDKFKDLCLSKAQRFLVEWETKMEERAEFISMIPYDAETFEMLDKLLEKTDKIWKQYMNCLKDVEDEKHSGSSRGGAVESLKDQNEI